MLTSTAISPPAIKLNTGETVQSSTILAQAPRPLPCSPARGTRKFSVKSSPRPTTRNTKPIPKPIEPITCAASVPNWCSSCDSSSASTTTPATMSKPAASEVEISSTTGRSSRRSPSSRVLSKISSGSGDPIDSEELLREFDELALALRHVVERDVREARPFELVDLFAPLRRVVAEDERTIQVLLAHELRDRFEIPRELELRREVSTHCGVRRAFLRDLPP